MSRNVKWKMMPYILLAAGLSLAAVGLCADDQTQDLNIEVKLSHYAYPDKIKVNQTEQGLEVTGVVKLLRQSNLPIGGYVLVQLLDRDKKVLAETRGVPESASTAIRRTRGLKFSVIFTDPPTHIYTVRVWHKSE